MAKIHEIDPNTDTVIILKNPLADFAVWNRPDEEDFNSTGSVSPVERPPDERPADESDVEASEPDDSSGEEIRYHVSSSVLKLASSHFERMLSRRGWKESTPNEHDGRYYIVVEDWDEEALLILLNALHLRNRQVPRSLSLETIAKIALLVEYYNCAETVELWTDLWIEMRIKDLSPSIRLEPSRDLFLWMYIAWVFQLANEFTRTTAAAIEWSNQNELSISNLPVGRFIDRITSARNDAISVLVSKLHELRDKYRSNDYDCPESENSFECGSILYGALTKGMDSLGFLPKSQDAPFSKMSLQEICTSVCQMRSPEWYTYGRNRRSSHSSSHSSCNLNRKLQEIAEDARKSIKGLQLTDFSRIESS